MRKRLLLVAFHFPPLQGSTGVHRALAFARYLGRYGWDVAVLTAAPLAYPNSSPDNNALIPPEVLVARALALDARRHLALFGRYPLALATPDRWSTWIWPAVRVGRRLAKEWRPHAILSTYPIASAHEIAWRLSAGLELPWVADFRDPMGQESYPEEQRIRRAYWDLERRVMQRCSAVTLTTEGTADLYRRRYPAFPENRIRVIMNGFDAEAFALLPESVRTLREPASQLQFLHSGSLFPLERNPECLFKAIAELRSEGRLSPATARFDLRGAGYAERYRPMLSELGIADMVRLLPALPYRDALREMQSADILMLLQADNCNLQVPAKLYEYLYVGRPIIGLTDPAGDTGRLLAELGINAVAPLHDVAALKPLVLRAIHDARQGTASVPPRESVMRFSREAATKQLAGLLDELTSV